MIRVARFVSFLSGEFGGPVRQIKELSKYLELYPIKTTIYAASEIDYLAKKSTIKIFIKFSY